MKLFLIFSFLIFGFSSQLKSQTGTLQIYCLTDVAIYVDDQFKGKTNTEISGLLIENIPAKEINVRAVKNGYATQTKTIKISDKTISELKFEMEKQKFFSEKKAGIIFHFGTFGLFNVNNSFTKADYSAGFSPFFDFKFHPYFSAGAEIMTMWGKPKTDDVPRMMINPNLRFSAMFSPLQKINIELTVAGGFAFWPSSSDAAFLTPTFNEQRIGWDFHTMAGIEFILSKKAALNVNFGYWASSSTSDNIIWITHDSMLLSAGPVVKF